MNNRKEYIDEIAEKMKKWDDEIVAMESEAKNSREDMKAEYNRKIAELRGKKEELNQKLEEAKNAGDDAWEIMKDGIKKSANEIKDALDKAKVQFK